MNMKAFIEVSETVCIERVVHFAMVDGECKMCVKIKGRRVLIIDSEFDSEGITTVYKLGEYIDAEKKSEIIL